MRKGTTALQNVQLLKWCREYRSSVGLEPALRVPRRNAEPTTGTCSTLLPSIRFLGSAGACGPLRLDRFSPYFEQSEPSSVFATSAPLGSYRYLYPFDGRHSAASPTTSTSTTLPSNDPRGFADDVIRYVAGWQKNRESGTLTATRRADGHLRLDDTSYVGDNVESVVLGGLEQAAYEFCDRAHQHRTRSNRTSGSRFPAASPSNRRRFARSSSLPSPIS